MDTATAGTASAVPGARAFAVAYAEHAWPVFRLHELLPGERCGCGNPDCNSPGKHPDALRWQNTIASVAAAECLWRGRLARRGIGLACGERARMWVLDADTKSGGLEALERLECDYGELPESLRVASGGGGLHIFFKWPDDEIPVTNHAGGLPAGIDVRGQGGYVVLPPSPHVSGNRYRWLVPPRTGQLSPAPEWLLELVRQPQRSLPVRDADADDVLAPGRRHQGLLRIAIGLVTRGITDADLLAGALAGANHDRCRPPLEPAEVSRIAEWARTSKIARRELDFRTGPDAGGFGALWASHGLGRLR